MTDHLLQPRLVTALSALGIGLSTAFSIGSLTLTYFAIPALLLPADAPLMPPLELVAERRARHFRTEKAPEQPADSGLGDEDETLLDHGAVEKIISGKNRSSSEGYLLRQWFHLFAKGMHTFPPLAVSGALCYGICIVVLPGRILQTKNVSLLWKRGLFATSAILSAGIMIFTLTVMKPVNSALHDRVKKVVEYEGQGKSAGSQSDIEDTERLIRKWGRVNAWRSVLPVLAAAFATAALAV
ncbi:hypothetical protein LTR84_011466 [Exophiala bonariae]|uniref:DUF1772-domain-containing protein n=1 Tax=Exophiala bonariae TaxID=1690606 RepID=A0AAV9NJS1_9EURO|nr:hypothetical protein LTR84_011466 [Exophiala bonariae]